MTAIDFDAVLKQVGSRGRYQNKLYYLLCIPATLPGIFLAFNQVFVSATPDHWCRVPELDSVFSPEEVRSIAVPFTLRSDGFKVYSSCEMYDVNFTDLLVSFHDDPANLPVDPDWNRTQCQYGWHYDKTNFDETLVSKLDIVCDKSWWVTTSTTCFTVGSLLGNLIFGFVGDKLGRRPAFLVVLLWHMIFSIATAFSTDYVTYTVLRSVNALVFPAIYQIPFVLSIELMGPDDRTFAGMMMCIMYSLALAALALITYVLRDWYSLLLWTSLPFVTLFAYYWIIPESPRWLITKGRIKEAETIVQEIAKVNKRSIPVDYLKTIQEENAKLVPVNKDDLEINSNVTIMDMMKRPLLLRAYLICILDWVANSVVYTGLTYNAGNLGVSDQVAVFVGAAIEIPSTLISWWAMDKLGRRTVVVVAMLGGGLACVACGLVPDDEVWALVTLAMIGRFGINSSYAVFYLMISEILPTVIRTQTMSFASFMSEFALLSFPSIVYLAVYNKVLPLLVFGALSLSGALASIMLPETLGKLLPETLEDSENLHRQSGIFCSSYVSCANCRRKTRINSTEDGLRHCTNSHKVGSE